MSVTAILKLGNHIAVLVLGEEAGLAIEVVQGQTAAWNLTFKLADNSAFDLTGAAYTAAAMFDTQAVGSGTGTTAAGTFATVSAAAGTATFSPAAADVTLGGRYVFEVKITKATLTYFFRTPVTILERYQA